MTQYAKVYSNTGVFLDRLPNAKTGYTLKDAPLSTGKLVLPADDDGNEICQPYNRAELFDGDERIGLFRFIAMPSSSLKAVNGNYTYKLEHVLATLMDNIMPGGREIGGTGVTMSDCINYILSFQSVQRWQLGTCDFNTQFQYSFSSPYLLNALLALPKQLAEDYRWTWDDTTTPWTLNLVRPSTTVECELRYRHNMLEIAKTYDAADLCTRCYPFGYGEGVNQLTIRDANDGVLFIDADTIGTWGIVEKPFVDTTIENADALKLTALQWMEAYKNPRMSYTIKAIDLYKLTGEPMDRFYPGKLCRVNDQEHGVTVSVRVTQITKNDPAASPGDVQVTLATSADSVANEIADLANRTSINELYAQGATNIFQAPYWNNADKDHPIEIPVDIPAECVRINKLWLIMHIGQFRSYSKGAAAGGGSTRTTTAGGAGTTTSAAGGGGTTGTIGTQQTGNTALTTETPDVGASGASTGSTGASSTANTGNTALTTETPNVGTTGSGGAVDTGGSTAANTAGASNYTTSEASGYTDYATASHYHTVNSHRHYVTAVSAYTNLADASTGASDNTSHRHGLGSHTHTMGHTHNMSHTHTGGAHTHTISHTHDITNHNHTMAHTHTLSDHTHSIIHTHDIPNHNHTIPSHSHTIADHTHTVTTEAHSHSVTLADHTHNDVPGIYDGDTVDVVTVAVDGNAVPSEAITDGQVNLIPYLSKDEAGKVIRGEHTITLTPVATATNVEGNCSIGGNVSAVVFIRSQGGGDY